MRATLATIAALCCGLIVTGCPGRNTPEPEVLEGRAHRLPGLAAFTTEMLRHGAGERSTEEIAETIEIVGGDLWVEAETDYVTVQSRVLSDQVDLAMALLADLAQRPTFPTQEIEKVRRREIDRLSLMEKRPRVVAMRELHRELYGELHPYGQYDADPEAIARLDRTDLVGFHERHFVPRNAFLVVSGDVSPDDVSALAERHFSGWTDRAPPAHEIPPAPDAPARRVLVVDTPGATQAQVAYGTVALDRAHEDYIPLRVANLVLGGNASARLFMNLRERCGYGYGAYSSVSTRLGAAPIYASGAFEASEAPGALRELFAELSLIAATEAPADEVQAAQSYMNGTFPMITETAGNLAQLATIQRVFGLPDDYWSRYRSAIQEVTPASAHAAARRYVRPDRGVLVIVGDASLVAWPARRYGDVRIVSPQGAELGTMAAAPEEWPGGEPDACPAEPEAAAPEGEGREAPPEPDTPRDLSFPDVHVATLDNGLEVLTIERRQLPLAYVGLVVRSGSASDPL